MTAVRSPEALLSEAEEEARAKFHAYDGTPTWPGTVAQGVAQIDLPLWVIGVQRDRDGFEYWYHRRPGLGYGVLTTRKDALQFLADIEAGCSCYILQDALCIVHGDPRDTSVGSLKAVS